MCVLQLSAPVIHFLEMKGKEPQAIKSLRFEDLAVYLSKLEMQRLKRTRGNPQCKWASIKFRLA